MASASHITSTVAFHTHFLTLRSRVSRGLPFPYVPSSRPSLRDHCLLVSYSSPLLSSSLTVSHCLTTIFYTSLQVSNAGDADVMNGFFACEFTTTEAALASNLASTPLLIQIWDAPSVAGRDPTSRLRRIADIRNNADGNAPQVRSDDTYVTALYNFERTVATTLLHQELFFLFFNSRVLNCILFVVSPHVVALSAPQL